MRRSFSCLLLGASLCLSSPAGAMPAQRIVSLDLCTDWMLARYADPARVAALSPMHRRFPVAWLDAGWPAHDGSLERILELRPDLVITGEYNALQLRGRLQTLGVRVEILPLPTTLAAVGEYERRLLALVGRSDTPPSAAPPPKPGPHPPKRLLLLGANGIGTGRGTFEDGILERAGWTNYLRDEGYVRLDLERIATDPPDAVLWAAPASQALANRFAEHPVLRRTVPPERWLATDYWRWQCPGPWTWELVGQLNRWLD
ncbi:ABC transporter substrate-binding protein [Pseudothauera rhizosphaerae]|uniref:ABC transporter substrate-binding protein n=1 Tax=Pseudothauera rhizosphaerae TaxID=2565932 RepID=A0A4S4AH97_9RHOO|nr:ABC transporter substrate-binding protein [Pseudothauera rhizosphaerae]THF58650.1 ABC transporter substrate-binding protein [Pseudothauera rhizosphaerae]